MSPAMVLKQGQKTFRLGDRPVPVLRGVDLEIRVGEMVAVMGASGSGKTTLLAILGLLESLSAGRYFLFGRDTAGWSPEERARVRNREIGFVFQNFNLLPRLTAWQNVALPLLYAGVPAARRRQRAMELLGLVGLAAFADHSRPGLWPWPRCSRPRWASSSATIRRGGPRSSTRPTPCASNNC